MESQELAHDFPFHVYHLSLSYDKLSKDNQYQNIIIKMFLRCKENSILMLNMLV